MASFFSISNIFRVCPEISSLIFVSQVLYYVICDVQDAPPALRSHRMKRKNMTERESAEVEIRERFECLQETLTERSPGVWLRRHCGCQPCDRSIAKDGSSWACRMPGDRVGCGSDLGAAPQSSSWRWSDEADTETSPVAAHTQGTGGVNNSW